VRLAWHDSGTFDQALQNQWPAGGGANGSIRFDAEMEHGANAGLRKALMYLKPFKTKFAAISWADLIQLASATAIEAAGGPRIAMRYGRQDTRSEADCPKDGNLPGPGTPDHLEEDGSPSAAAHVRKVFYRMGFGDAEIVALLGAHTLGRAFHQRSGVTEHGYGRVGGATTATAFTQPQARVRHDGAAGIGMAGGESWVKGWLSFDNEYYQYLARGPTPGLLWLPTDAAMHSDAGFRPHWERFARDEQAFFYE
jgi:L-ascorbate peroxidase